MSSLGGRLRESDLEGAEFSQKVQCKDQSDVTLIQSDVTFACLLLNNMSSCCHREHTILLSRESKLRNEKNK